MSIHTTTTLNLSTLTAACLADGFRLTHLTSLADYESAFPIIRQLRPDLNDAQSWFAYAQRNHTHGYRLLGLFYDHTLCALASYRLQENLVHGNYLYLEDLVTDQAQRGQGLGEILLAAVRDLAQKAGCKRLILDTLLSNSLAHRFYFRQGLLASSLRFNQALQGA